MVENYPVRRSSKQRRRREIKEKIVNTFMGFMILAIMHGCAGLVGYIETHYNREVVVIETTENSVIMEDKVGHIWEYETVDYKVGDILTLKMYNNHTDNIIEDDIILAIK